MSTETSRQFVDRICFFCGEAIQEKAERHHIRPRRTFRRGDNHRKDNIALCHSSCHREWHHRFDNPRMKWWEYKRAFEPIGFGEGVFAGD
jgi:hypothetical protein